MELRELFKIMMFLSLVWSHFPCVMSVNEKNEPKTFTTIIHNESIQFNSIHRLVPYTKYKRTCTSRRTNTCRRQPSETAGTHTHRTTTNGDEVDSS